eukprot:TRINITY_DN212_c0_g1_i1.p1 TRINITY_DN212_c0_g1~~TRINITY_DN212_c0_g1_i1.p1  ORF type:complete len:133 (+),score=43.22 TRINITY_DN212_c0_g1_i1:61-459(+)
MSTIPTPDIHARPIQDGPPSGGFKPVRWGRSLPDWGPSPRATAIGVAVFLAGSYAFLIFGNKQRQRNAAEKYQARATLIPILQAEEDARFVAQMDEFNKREAEIMKGKAGWQPRNPYFTQKFVPPHSTKAQL